MGLREMGLMKLRIRKPRIAELRVAEAEVAGVHTEGKDNDDSEKELFGGMDLLACRSGIVMQRSKAGWHLHSRWLMSHEQSFCPQLAQGWHYTSALKAIRL